MMSSLSKCLLALTLSIPLSAQPKLSLPCIAEWAKTANAEQPKEDKEAFLHGPFARARLIIDTEEHSLDLPVTCHAPEAEQYFKQGLTQLHGFWHLEAERSFRQALASDPQFAMAYWGLALVNLQRPPRATYFIKQAGYKAAQNSGLERELIASYADHISSPDSKKFVRQLEKLILKHPKIAELKALLLRHLVFQENKSSHLALSFLADQIPAQHPGIAHYRSLLWLNERPELARLNAPDLLRSKIPDSARYAGETFQATGRHEEALKAFQSAVKKDLLFLSRQFENPHLAQSLASNYQAYIECLSGLGRLDEALRAAEDFVSLPRRAPDHPLFFHLPSSTYHTALETTAKILIDHQQWDRLETLDQHLQLIATPGPEEQAERLSWKGIAAKARGQSTEEIAVSLTEMGHPHALKKLTELENFTPNAVPESLTLGSSFAAQIAFCEGQFKAGKLKEAIFPIDHIFRQRLQRGDPSLNWESRLSPLSKKMPRPIEFAYQRPTLETLPSPLPLAPSWALPDGLDGTTSLSDYHGKPVLVIFYLGSGCLHCIEQLNAFYPRAADFKASGIPIVAISTDPKEKLGETLAAERKTSGNFPFKVLSDSQFDIFRQYRAFDEFDQRPLHGTFLISEEGKVLWSSIGNEPFMEPVWLLEEARRLLPPQ